MHTTNIFAQLSLQYLLSTSIVLPSRHDIFLFLGPCLCVREFPCFPTLPVGNRVCAHEERWQEGMKLQKTARRESGVPAYVS
jgi:hypothetical protein